MATTFRKSMDRRTFLRGAGTVAIGLPFLEEMMPRRAVAAATSGTPRLVTLFFGLGIDKNQQNEGFAGPLQPYQPFANKMSLFTNVSMTQAGGGGGHIEASPVLFVGEKKVSNSRAGAASIDQVMKNFLHKDGVPPTLVNTLTSGLWYRAPAPAMAFRVWNPDGTNRVPIKRPSKLFDTLFGSVPPPSGGGGPDPAVQKQLRIKRSVLDTVVGQYTALRGDTSYLGAASKQKLDAHFQGIREVERLLAPAETTVTAMTKCTVPTKPTDPPIAEYDRPTYGAGFEAPKIAWQDFQTVYRLHADLWAMALRCDLVRFGNLMFESAGGHTHFMGKYTALGQTLDFDTTEARGSQHDSYFHANLATYVRLYQHFSQTNLAYVLGKLNDPTFLEANGKTVLDNTLVVIGTEYGQNHQLSNVFHAIVGGHGHFKPGTYAMPLNAIDIYNAALRPYGIDAKIGSKTGVTGAGDIPGLLA